MRDLTLQLTADASRLVKAEARLAQLEIQQRAKRAAVGASMFGAAGLAAFLGICCVVAAFILGLANVLQPWFAALITAGLLFLLGLFIVLPGWKGVKDRRPITTDVVGSVKADIETVRRGFPR